MQLPLRRFRGQPKPPGMPRLDRSRIPRGLRSCFPFADPAWSNLGPGNNMPLAFRGTSVAHSITALGQGMFGNASSNAGCLSYTADNLTAAGSIEVLFVSAVTPVQCGLAGFNLANTGDSVTEDKALFVDINGHINGYVFDGASKLATDTDVLLASTIYHAAMTWDSTNLILYKNGAQAATIGAGAARSLSPSFLCFGSISAGGTGNKSGRNRILLASYADVPWTANEVAARAADPYAYLIYPDEDVMASMIGVTRVGGAVFSYWLS